MLKRLTIMALTGAAILGASVAAQAQSTSGIGNEYRSGYADYARSRGANFDRRLGTVGRDFDRRSSETYGDTAEGGNASPPAGGVGRVNSRTQE